MIFCKLNIMKLYNRIRFKLKNDDSKLKTDMKAILNFFK